MFEVAKNAPVHIGVIMDGNGRWAKSHGKARTFGHKIGALAIKKTIRGAIKFGVKYLTFYAFSTENWSRPEAEVEYLMFLFDIALKKYTNVLVKNDIRFIHLGDKARLPKNISEKLTQAEELTKNCSKLVLCLAINYGSRDEILRAVRLFSNDCVNRKTSNGELNWSKFSSYFYTKDIPDPELVIRTSGEQRLSNFLLAQAAYSEFYFTPVHWPDFTEDTLYKAIEDYKHRDRRFGRIGN